MPPTLAATDAASTLMPTDEPAGGEADAGDEVERWVGVSATVVVVLAGMAALLV
jgi:hypothetical protein